MGRRDRPGGLSTAWGRDYLARSRKGWGACRTKLSGPPGHSLGRTPQGRNLQRHQRAPRGASVTGVVPGRLPGTGVPWLGGVRTTTSRGEGQLSTGYLFIYLYLLSPINLPPLPTPLSHCHLSGAILCSSSGSQAPFLPSLPLSLPAPSPQDANVTTPPSVLEPASPLIPPGELQALPPSSAHLTRPGQMLYDPFLPPCSKALKGPGCPPVGPAAGKDPHKHSATRHTQAAAWW